MRCRPGNETADQELLQEHEKHPSTSVPNFPVHFPALETNTRCGWKCNLAQKSPSCWFRNEMTGVEDAPRGLCGDVPRGLEQAQERDGDDVRSETRNIAIVMTFLQVLKSVVVVILVPTAGSNTLVDPGTQKVPKNIEY